MPELPEIETVKIQLQKHLVGQVIERLEQLHPKSVQGDVGLVSGKKIVGVERCGKMLIIHLEGGLDLAIHFKMSGQLVLVRSLQSAESRKENIKNRRVEGSLNNVGLRVAGGHPTQDWIGELPSRHTRAIFHLKDEDRLFFNDQRIFGWVKILSDKEVRKLAFLQKLGPEPWDITDEEFFNLLNKRKKAIKLVIMDQEVISGTGNIYANDALWEARIHPLRPAQSLTSMEAKLLRQGLVKVLKEGIKYGGATATDDKYINLDGLGGHYQDHFRVYDREGQPCLRCKAPIIKITLGGRGTYFCPRCQVIRNK